MCGIAGVIHRGEGVSSTTIEAMALALSHRGPDDQGFFGVDGKNGVSSWKVAGEKPGNYRVAFGFRRLSILDLSLNGSQPMTTPDGRFTLIFNGQIYNYIELREQFPEVNFKSTSDTEVLLHMLAKHGPAALTKLNGIFGLALFDRETRTVLIARDALGVKPLYYYRDRERFVFASEIRSLFKGVLSKPQLRVELVERYLMSNWIADPDTLFKDVYKLEPGHFAVIGPDLTFEPQRYWDLSFESQDAVTESQWIDRLEESLDNAIERQLRSDVPVGFFLSGGVDSSLLAVKAIPVQKERPTTFTIGFQWSHSKDNDLDLESARLLKQKFPFNHNEILLAPSIVSLLPKVVATLEEPINDPAAVCSYLICEAAAQRNFKVLISGQGGDEIFGGYHVYPAGKVVEGMTHLPKSLLGLMGQAVEQLPYAVEGKRFQTVHRVKKLFASTKDSWPLPFCLLRSAYRRDQARELLTSPAQSVQENPFARHQAIFERAAKWDVIHQMMYLDTKTYLPSLNLTYSDKTSMRHSVELRVPLLDLEVVGLMQLVPSRYKSTLSRSKILLKALADRSLPKEVVHRKKTGFGLPLRDWFLNELQPLATEVLSPERLRKQQIFQAEMPTQLLMEHRAMKADHSMKLYSLMTFQLWLEQFEL